MGATGEKNGALRRSGHANVYKSARRVAMGEKVRQDEWLELSKKLRNRVSGYFDPKQLETIDEFIRLAASQFDQVSQQG